MTRSTGSRANYGPVSLECRGGKDPAGTNIMHAIRSKLIEGKHMKCYERIVTINVKGKTDVSVIVASSRGVTRTICISDTDFEKFY